jgi:hypothetical protein
MDLIGARLCKNRNVTSELRTRESLNVPSISRCIPVVAIPRLGSTGQARSGSGSVPEDGGDIVHHAQELVQRKIFLVVAVGVVGPLWGQPQLDRELRTAVCFGGPHCLPATLV